MATGNHDAKSKRVKSSKRKHAKEKMSDPAFEHILELVKSLQDIYKQSYALQRPIVDALCANADNVSERELEQCFDRVLDISCSDCGMKLFNKLCRTFKARYPVCVMEYIKIQKEVYGDDEK